MPAALPGCSPDALIGPDRRDAHQPRIKLPSSTPASNEAADSTHFYLNNLFSSLVHLRTGQKGPTTQLLKLEYPRRQRTNLLRDCAFPGRRYPLPVHYIPTYLSHRIASQTCFSNSIANCSDPSEHLSVRRRNGLDKTRVQYREEISTWTSPPTSHRLRNTGASPRPTTLPLRVPPTTPTAPSPPPTTTPFAVHHPSSTRNPSADGRASMAKPTTATSRAAAAAA